MSRNDLIKTMEVELTRLNREIDLKIIRGLSYRREAKLHRFLSAQLSNLTINRSHNWMGRVLSSASTFIF